MRAFGCGEFGDVPAAQYLGVVRRDPQSRRIPTGVGAAGRIQRSDAGAARLLPALRCAGRYRSPEPVLERQVIPRDVVGAAAQGRATRPVHLPGVAQIYLTQCPRERFDGLQRDWQPRLREGTREPGDPHQRVTEIRRRRHARLTPPAVGPVRPGPPARGPPGT